MKLFPLLILATLLLCSCGSADKKPKNDRNELVYETEPVNAADLSAICNLSGDMARGELLSQIKLTGSETKDINIQEIIIATSDGLRSLPITAFAPFLLKQGKDTILSLKFNPLNNLKVYRVTGMQGSLKPVYTISISYKTAGADNPLSLSLKSFAEKNAYLNYNRKYNKPLTGYSFNAKNGFNEQEKKYLATLKQVPQPPFVYLSEQEIAISGLNFRLRSYYRQDTVHAELFVVNHADFPVKFIKDDLDIDADEKSWPGEAKTITIEKVSGSQQHLSMMEKGDRILIHFKKHMEIKTPAKEYLVLNIRKAFMLTGKKALFGQDVQLIPGQF